MRLRQALACLVLLATGGCSFDSTFFPVDERPDDEISAEHIALTSADGTVVDHLLVKPAFDPKATIFVLQGSGSKASNWVRLLLPLVENGFQVFLMEYRGFGNSGGAATHEQVRTDATAAFGYLIAREDVAGRRLVVLGQSYGGQLAIHLAVEHPEAVDALVIEGTFTSFRDIAIHSTTWIARPFTWLLFMNPYRSATRIQDVSVPTLIIHSREDEVVPFWMGQELYDLAGGPKELWAIDGGHTDALIDYPEQFIARVSRLAGLEQRPQ